MLLQKLPPTRRKRTGLASSVSSPEVVSALPSVRTVLPAAKKHARSRSETSAPTASLEANVRLKISALRKVVNKAHATTLAVSAPSVAKKLPPELPKKRLQKLQLSSVLLALSQVKTAVSVPSARSVVRLDAPQSLRLVLLAAKSVLSGKLFLSPPRAQLAVQQSQLRSQRSAPSYLPSASASLQARQKVAPLAP